MNSKDLKILTHTLTMSDSEVIESAVQRFQNRYKDVITDNANYVYAKGNNPLCLVAHIDTLRKVDDVKLMSDGNMIVNKHGVLGADDRAGVAAIFIILKRLSNDNLPSIIFTNHEERGGIGVKQFIEDKVFDPEGVNLFIEIDREGIGQFVYYSDDIPDPVAFYVESFGFFQEYGSYSDVADLSDAYLIPHVNVSAGYYRQHTSREFLMIDGLDITIKRVSEMLCYPIEHLYKLTAPRKKLTYDVTKYTGGKYNYQFDAANYNGYADVINLEEYSTAKQGTGVKPFKPTLNDFLVFFTQFDLCPECGLDWQQCGCGQMLNDITGFFSVEDLIILEQDLGDCSLKRELRQYLYSEDYEEVHIY